jgi:chromosome segregation ATPase
MSIFTKIKNLFTLEARVTELEDVVGSKEEFTQHLVNVLKDAAEVEKPSQTPYTDFAKNNKKENLDEHLENAEEHLEDSNKGSYEKFYTQEYTNLEDKVTALEAEIESLMDDNHALALKVSELKNKEITTKEAMDRLREDLSEDKNPGSYYHSWQCNIAMSFFDVCRQNKDKVKVSTKNLHEISNKAAKNFLDLLIK